MYFTFTKLFFKRKNSKSFAEFEAKISQKLILRLRCVLTYHSICKYLVERRNIMCPSVTTQEMVKRIEELESRRRPISKRKREDLEDKKQWAWNMMHRLHPDLEHVTNINYIKQLLKHGLITPMWMSAYVGAKPKPLATTYED